jgi:metallo-beta-lactamase family protein
MKITFHGAARTVTGSKHLVHLSDNRKILLDCGMFQGMGRRTTALNAEFGFDAKDVSFVLLSHAHIDHSGLLPKLVKEGFAGKIYCTPATLDLTEILLLDSASIQEHDNDDTTEALYTTEDVVQTMQQFSPVAYDEWIEPSAGVNVMFTHTGHLIGSAAIHLKIDEGDDTTTLSYTADIGRAKHALLQAATPFPQSEYLIVESTYGDKHHPLPGSAIDALLKLIKQTCIVNKGQLIIAAFSVGRTQELLFLLNQLGLEKRLPQVPYFVDSPLGSKATAIMKKYKGEFNETLQKILLIDDDPFSFEGLKWVENVDDSKRLVEYTEPCVIIAASGTGDAGRIRHHIRKGITNPANTILFSGYCGPESTGGELLAGGRTIECGRDSAEVVASIEQLAGMSAHGDSNDICAYLQCQDPAGVRGVFLVHGEYKVQQALAKKLEQRAFYPVHIPEANETFTLKIAKTASLNV